MKAILQSIRPQHCANIAAGIKKIEVRKTKPKIKTPFKVYIYCTKKKKPDEYYNLIFYKDDNGICHDEKTGKLCSPLDTGKVIGEYVCDYITTDFLISDTCISVEDLERYSGNKAIYGWHISNLKIYDEPKELNEFRKSCELFPCINNNFWGKKSNYSCNQCMLTRPPQSWCYVEV